MNTVKMGAFIGSLLMAGAISYALLFGDFAEDGATLLSNPWGIVSLVDLYVGFALFSIWVIYREKSPVRSLIWIFFLITLGFFTASIYTFIAAQQSGGNWQRFWLGNRLMNK